jgi:hypothetical protein
MRRGRGRAEETLEPVRGRPRRAVLARAALVAALLMTAATVVWSSSGPAGGSRPAGNSGPAGGSDSAPAPSGMSDTRAGSGNAGAPGGSGRSGGHDAGGGSKPSEPAGARGSPPDPAAARGADLAAAGVGGDARVPVPPGLVGVPVRLADPTALAMVGAGDRVDLLLVRDGGRSEPVAEAALVLAITGANDPLAGGMLLALDPVAAKRAVASPGHGFAVLLRPG